MKKAAKPKRALELVYLTQEQLARLKEPKRPYGRPVEFKHYDDNLRLPGDQVSLMRELWLDLGVFLDRLEENATH